MINEDSLRQVESSQWTARFIKPLYDTYCFAQIPNVIRQSLTGEQDTAASSRLLGPLAGPYDTVILFFIDAFGWRFFEQYRDQYPFLQRFAQDGYVSKLTSQFPSTTAAHVTAAHTGLPVGQSGVYEWYYYEPRVDAVIAPLLFSYAGDHTRNTLYQAEVAPIEIYPRTTIYAGLKEQGVQSFVFQHQDYTPSPYSDVVFAGSQVMPYKTISEALATLTTMVRGHHSPGYYFLYFDRIDAVCHRYGPASAQVHAEIDTFLTTMERLVHQELAGKAGKTLFLMTADHGQVEIDPATTTYINTELPEITRYLKVNRAGRPIVPAGSPRDLFLHVADGHVDDACAHVRERLSGRAEVYRVRDLIEQGFFGTGELSPTFLSRVGDVVILPYQHQAVWWYEKDRFEQHYYGHHGGLTRQEMETLLLAYAYA